MTSPDAIAMVRRAVERAAGSCPGDDEDLLDAGIVDSMGWVDILSMLEEQAGAPNLGASWPQGRPRSIQVLAELLQWAAPRARGSDRRNNSKDLAVGIGGWGAAPGARVVTAETLDCHYRLLEGTIRQRTGLESVVWAADEENETVLAQRACEQALRVAQVEIDDVDLLVASSETFLGFPSLAATLHSVLLLPPACWALDVGGGCLGLLNALAAAQAVLGAGAASRALVVAADVHSRRFAGTSAPWQLAALFGDAAGALLLDRAGGPYQLGQFLFGCRGTFASAIRIVPGPAGDLSVDFRGPQLADAAISQLAQVIGDLEIRAGLKASEVDAFAIHEPNPRAVEMLARKTRIPIERFAQVSRTCGNLGSATCAVALSRLLDRRPMPRYLFLAALGPGLLWGGGLARSTKY